MSFIGLITRRVLKQMIYTFIDETESNPTKAKQKKQAAAKIIMAVGLTISLSSLDFVGLMDALHDHGIDIAQSTIEHAADHGSNVMDHASNVYDSSDHFTYTTSHTDIKFGERMPSFALSSIHDIFGGSTSQMQAALNRIISNRPSLSYLSNSGSVESALEKAREVLGAPTFQTLVKGLPKFD